VSARNAGGHPERRGRAAGLVRALQRPRGDPLIRVGGAHGRRHGVEEVLRAGKGEVGLAQYEVRVGWAGTTT